jgi:hypothetical protein
MAPKPSCGMPRSYRADTFRLPITDWPDSDGKVSLEEANVILFGREMQKPVF